MEYCKRIFPACRFFGEQGAVEISRTDDGVFSNGRVEARLTREQLGPGRERIVHLWKNVSGEPIRIQPEIRAKAAFAYERYLIPGVNANGNEWGKGGEPKGLNMDGEPWVFEYRRTTIPSCSISESEQAYLALMASDEDEASLVSSCSMISEDGRMLHRILYPVIERPKTYSYRDRFGPAYDEWIELAPGEQFRAA